MALLGGSAFSVSEIWGLKDQKVGCEFYYMLTVCLCAWASLLFAYVSALAQSKSHVAFAKIERQRNGIVQQLYRHFVQDLGRTLAIAPLEHSRPHTGSHLQIAPEQL